MNKFILLFAFAALCFNGCKKDVVPPPDPGVRMESSFKTTYNLTVRALPPVIVENDTAQISTADTVFTSTDQFETAY